MFSSNNSQVANDVKYIEDYFSTFLYSGTGSSQTINNGIDLATKGGLVWIKSRSAGFESHRLTDSARGTTKQLKTNGTDAQTTNSDTITAFNTTGFTLGTGATLGDTNASGETYVGWSIAKTPKFFDVVTYTGNGTSNRQIAHNLGSVPGCIIIKRTNASGSNWKVNHRSLAANQDLSLNLTNAADSANDFWDNTRPTSTNFTVGSLTAVNGNGDEFVAYLFAHNAGGFGLTGTDNVITCGSFTTDSGGSATVSLGYEPQWVLIKRTTGGTGSWQLHDNMRGFSLGRYAELDAESSGAEGAFNGTYLYPTATGFVGNGIFNTSSDFIYIAIRRGPMKVPTDATKVYNAISRTGTGATANVTGVGFPPDMLLDTMRSTSWTRSMWDRLRGPNLRIATNQTSAETSYTDAIMAYGQDGVTLGADGNFDVNGSGYTYINWFFRRAPSFFDEVCYTGTGSARTINHNLGVAPELLITKQRSGVSQWNIYNATLGASSFVQFTTAAVTTGDTTRWNGTAPTASVFSLGTSSSSNSSGQTFVAYLFATCAGVQYINSYVGDGTTGRTINCGFTGGARFVCIKATSTTGSWWTFDSARGIVTNNDPALQLNSTAAEVTSADAIDTASSGFIVNQEATCSLNASGVTYLVWAIA